MLSYRGSSVEEFVVMRIDEVSNNLDITEEPEEGLEWQRKVIDNQLGRPKVSNEGIDHGAVLGSRVLLRLFIS